MPRTEVQFDNLMNNKNDYIYRLDKKDEYC
jgi:hypothetical protein